MTKYSHTRISTYLNCPQKYRFEYIDKIETPFRYTDNTFMGSICHESLEYLYKQREAGKIISKEDFLKYYALLWTSKYNRDTIIHAEKDKTEAHYYSVGMGCLERYYEEFFVDDKMVILGLETDDTLELPNGDTYYIRIDKLGRIGDTYYVCDYKTDSKPKEQWKADEDRQLAMYALWVKKTYPDAKEIKLLWQMLRQEKEKAQVISTRTQEDLDNLEKFVCDTIEKINNDKEFPIGEEAFCDWCEYHDICPKFAAKKALTIEDGIALVNEYVDLGKQKREIETKYEKIKYDLIELAKQGDYEIINGTEKKISISKSNKIVYNDKEKVEQEIRGLGLIDKYLKFDIELVSKDIANGTADPRIKALVKEIETGYRLTASKIKIEKDEKER